WILVVGRAAEPARERVDAAPECETADEHDQDPGAERCRERDDPVRHRPTVAAGPDGTCRAARTGLSRLDALPAEALFAPGLDLAVERRGTLGHLVDRVVVRP